VLKVTYPARAVGLPLFAASVTASAPVYPLTTLLGSANPTPWSSVTRLLGMTVFSSTKKPPRPRSWMYAAPDLPIVAVAVLGDGEPLSHGALGEAVPAPGMTERDGRARRLRERVAGPDEHVQRVVATPGHVQRVAVRAKGEANIVFGTRSTCFCAGSLPVTSKRNTYSPESAGTRCPLAS
jgi:hypothetical protein